MMIIPLNYDFILYSLAFCAIVESLRIAIAFFFSRPSKEISKLQIEKLETNLELGTVKSVQLELVKHSLLTRKLIKIEKQIDKRQAEFLPKLRKVRSVGRIIRFPIYLIYCLYFYNNNFLIIDPKLIWPLSVFVSSKTLSLPIWVFIIAGAFCCRHIMKSVLQITFRQTEFA